MIALGQLGVDDLGSVSITGHVNLLEGHRLRVVVAGCRAHLVPLDVRHLEEVLVVLEDDVGLLDDDGRGLDLRDRQAALLVVSTVRVWLFTRVTKENHVPDAAFPAILEVVVPSDVLLLGARGGLAGNSAIGHVAATCVASLLVRREVLEQVEVTLDL